jgi:hypothetical protein
MNGTYSYRGLQADWPRYMVNASLVWNDAFNVVDTFWVNRFNEPKVILAGVSAVDAEAKLSELNQGN